MFYGVHVVQHIFDLHTCIHSLVSISLAKFYWADPSIKQGADPLEGRAYRC